MPPFRFRPEAVLTLRRKEEDAARDVLARAQADRTRAEQALAAATGAVDAARTALMTATSDGTDAGRLQWHQSWIARLRLDVDARRQVAAVSADTVDRAVASVRDAVQRRRVLERLRGRAWRRHQLEAERAQLRDMDRLAGQRHYAAATEHGEISDDQSDLPDLDSAHGRDGARRVEAGPARPRRVP